MPVPIERKRKSSTPRATPCHCSPRAARLTSFSSQTGRPRRSSSSRAERRALEAGDARRERDARCSGRRRRGRRRRRRRARSSRRPGRVDQRVAQLDDRVEHALRVVAVDLDVEARANVAAEVADRAAQEPAADVETEHERGLGNGLEEDRAVARAVRSRSRLADEAGVDERLERERDGRLRDAGAPRDLGAGDRRPGADRLEHGALVQVLEERRERGGRERSRRHLGWNPNRSAAIEPGA